MCNIRFIGELYKLKMLACKIMHECVFILLMTTDDESIECLCRLITTIGQVLEKETVKKMSTTPKERIASMGIREIAFYFTEMKKIIAEKVISARVRFLMQTSWTSVLITGRRGQRMPALKPLKRSMHKLRRSS